MRTNPLKAQSIIGDHGRTMSIIAVAHLIRIDHMLKCGAIDIIICGVAVGDTIQKDGLNTI
jgi:hypothetical protein